MQIHDQMFCPSILLTVGLAGADVTRTAAPHHSMETPANCSLTLLKFEKDCRKTVAGNAAQSVWVIPHRLVSEVTAQQMGGGGVLDRRRRYMVEHSSSKTEVAAECLQMISFLGQKLLSAIKSAHVLVSAHQVSSLNGQLMHI